MSKIDLSMTINNIHGEPILEINSYGEIDIISDDFSNDIEALLYHIEPITPSGVQEYVALNAMLKLYEAENAQTN